MLQASISDWGLHPAIVKEYEKRGVKNLYRWQSGALQEGIGGNNLVFSAPTSGMRVDLKVFDFLLCLSLVCTPQVTLFSVGCPVCSVATLLISKMFMPAD